MAGKLQICYQKLPRVLKWLIPSMLVMGLGTAVFFLLSNKPESSATPSSEVKYAVATQGSIVISASGSGTLVSKNERNISFGTSGEVVSVNVQVGDMVEKGDLLAVLDPSTAQDAYTSARLTYLNMTSPSAIAAVEKSLQNAKSDLSSAQSSLEYLISPTVFRWQVIVGEDEKALLAAREKSSANPSEAAENAVEAAAEKLAQSQQSLQYAWSTWESEYVPEMFTQTEVNQRTGVETVVYYTDSNGNTWPVVNKPTQDAISLAKANYDLARAAVDELDTYLKAVQGEDIPEDATGENLVKLLNAKNSLNSALEQLDAVNLTAPFNGTVMDLQIRVGDAVNNSTVALTISDISQPYYVEAYFDEYDWGVIKTGNQAEIVFDILPEEVFRGTVTEVTPGLVSGGGSKLVRCYITLIDSVGQDLPSGTAASVEVIGARADNAILVPVEAIREIGDNQYGVFVLVDGVLELRIVEVGIANDFKIEIRSGLSVGENVSTGIMETIK